MSNDPTPTAAGGRAHPTPAFVGESGPNHPFICARCGQSGECNGDCDGVQPFDDAHVHYDGNHSVARHSTQGLMCTTCGEQVPCAAALQAVRDGGYVGPTVSDDGWRFPPPSANGDGHNLHRGVCVDCGATVESGSEGPR